MTSDLRIVLVTDWLVTHRGGERVLECLAELFPLAPIFTLFHEPAMTSPSLQNHAIHASSLNRLAWARRHYPYLLPLFPRAIQEFELPPCDLVVSVSHAVAKGVRVPNGARHVCYCLTPMRYLWQRRDEYFSGLDWRRAAVGIFSGRLKRFDLNNEQVDRFLANSGYVKEQIEQIYRRHADVVYSPIDTDYFCPGSNRRSDYFLLVSALAPYKRVDLAVAAFNRSRARLIVVGCGPLAGALRRQGRSNIEFRGWVSDVDLRDLYRGARALVVTAKEDFGMAPLEAHACGTPVVALAAGGVLETMTRPTSVLFEQQDCRLLEQALGEFEQRSFDAEELRANALRFAKPVFQRGILEVVQGLGGN